MKYTILTIDNDNTSNKYYFRNNEINMVQRKTNLCLIRSMISIPSEFFWSSSQEHHFKYLTPLFEFNTIEEFEKEFMEYLI